MRATILLLIAATLAGGQSLNLGSGEVSKLYLGSTEVTKVYLGSTEINLGDTPGGGTNPGKDNLRGWWKFDDASGPFVDSHTNNYDLTPAGTPIYSQPGKNGNAVEFDGATEYGTITNSLGIADYPFSISGWIKTPGAGVSMSLASVSAISSSTVYYSSGIDTAEVLKLQARTGDDNFSAIGTTLVNTDQWVHVVSVFASDTDRRIYLNGNPIPEGSNSDDVNYNTNRDTFTAGALRRASGVIWYLDGLIDDTAMWSDELTPDEILWLYNNSFDDL